MISGGIDADHHAHGVGGAAMRKIKNHAHGVGGAAMRKIKESYRPPNERPVSNTKAAGMTEQFVIMPITDNLDRHQALLSSAARSWTEGWSETETER